MKNVLATLCFVITLCGNSTALLAEDQIVQPVEKREVGGYMWRRDGNQPLDHSDMEHLARNTAYRGGRAYYEKEAVPMAEDTHFRDHLDDNGLEFIDAIDDASTGFQATLVRDKKSNKVILMMRGTEPWKDTVKDIGADIEGTATGHLPTGNIGNTQYSSNKAKLSEWAEKYNNITVTAHSLGASNAQRFIADHPGVVEEAVLFNAPAIDNETANAANQKDLPKINYYINRDDAVSELSEGRHLKGEVVVVAGLSTDTESSGALASHSGAMLQGDTVQKRIDFDYWDNSRKSEWILETERKRWGVHVDMYQPERQDYVNEVQNRIVALYKEGKIDLPEGKKWPDVLGDLRDMAGELVDDDLAGKQTDATGFDKASVVMNRLKFRTKKPVPKQKPKTDAEKVAEYDARMKEHEERKRRELEVEAALDAEQQMVNGEPPTTDSDAGTDGDQEDALREQSVADDEGEKDGGAQRGFMDNLKGFAGGILSLFSDDLDEKDKDDANARNGSGDAVNKERDADQERKQGYDDGAVAQHKQGTGAVIVKEGQTGDHVRDEAVADRAGRTLVWMYDLALKTASNTVTSVGTVGGKALGDQVRPLTPEEKRRKREEKARSKQQPTTARTTTRRTTTPGSSSSSSSKSSTPSTPGSTASTAKPTTQPTTPTTTPTTTSTATPTTSSTSTSTATQSTGNEREDLCRRGYHELAGRWENKGEASGDPNDRGPGWGFVNTCKHCGRTLYHISFYASKN